MLIFSDNYINLGGSRILTVAHCLYKLDDEKLMEIMMKYQVCHINKVTGGIYKYISKSI